MNPDPNIWPTTWAEYTMVEEWFDRILPILEYSAVSFQAKRMLKTACDKHPQVWPEKGWERNWARLDEYFQERLKVEASIRDARSKGNPELGRHSVGWAARKKLSQLKAKLEDRLSSTEVTPPTNRPSASARTQGCQDANLPSVQALRSATHMHPRVVQVRTPQLQPFPNLKRKSGTEQPLPFKKRVKVSSDQEPLASHVLVANASSALSIPQVVSNINCRSTPAFGNQQIRVPSGKANLSTNLQGNNCQPAIHNGGVASSQVVPRDSEHTNLSAVSNSNLNRTSPFSIGALAVSSPSVIMSRTSSVFSGARGSQITNPNSLCSSPSAAVGTHPASSPMFCCHDPALAPNTQTTGFMSGYQHPAWLAIQGMRFIPDSQQVIASRAGPWPVTPPEVIDLVTPPPATEDAKNPEGAPVPLRPTIPADAPAKNIIQPEPDQPPSREMGDQVPEPATLPRVKVHLPLELEDLFTEEFFKTFVTVDETGSEIYWGPSNEDEESRPSVEYPDHDTAPVSSPAAEYSKNWFPIAILDLSAENACM